jgi:hypothetical protein
MNDNHTGVGFSDTDLVTVFEKRHLQKQRLTRDQHRPSDKVSKVFIEGNPCAGMNQPTCISSNIVPEFR